MSFCWKVRHWRGFNDKSSNFLHFLDGNVVKMYSFLSDRYGVSDRTPYRDWIKCFTRYWSKYPFWFSNKQYEKREQKDRCSTTDIHFKPIHKICVVPHFKVLVDDYIFIKNILVISFEFLNCSLCTSRLWSIMHI